MILTYEHIKKHLPLLVKTGDTKTLKRVQEILKMDQEEYKGYTIKIEPDEDAQNPRTDRDNLGKIICFHKQYELGDKHNYRSDDFTDWEELRKQLVKDGAVVIAPLYLYDHSGLRIKIGSFQGLLPQGHAEFDSGQVGFIVAFAKDIKTEFPNVKKISQKIKDHVGVILEQEVSTYDQYLSGDVWGYRIENDKVDQIEDIVDWSCWGFYGYDYCLEEAKNAVDTIEKATQEAREARTKKYIKSQVPLVYRT